GSSLRVDMALSALNPATPISMTGASAPPQSAKSDSPRMMELYASPILCDPVAQAETAQKLGPLKPYFMETCPEAMSGINIGMKNGDTALGPRSLSEIDCW